MKLSTYIFTTVQLFNDQDATLYATSDGLAPDFKGSFRWVMRKNNGVDISTNCDTDPGYCTTSF